MKIDKNTRFIDFFALLDVLDAESEKKVLNEAQKAVKNYYSLTIGELFACMHEDFSAVGIDINDINMTALQGAWIKGFSKFIDDLSKALHNLTVAPSAEMSVCQQKCMPLSFEESILIFIRDYFNLHSFNDVYDVCVSDFLIAKKDTYNRLIAEKSFAELQKRKQKSKK